MAAPPRSADPRLATLGTVAAVAAVTSWGIGPVVVKDTDLGGLAVAFYRLSIGALLSVVILFATGRRLRWRTMVAAVPGGAAFGLDILLFFTAVKWTTVADATVISALQPALVLLVVGRLFGERVRTVDVAWTGVAIVGVGVVVFASGSIEGRSLKGDILATLALGAWAWYFVAVKQARRHVAALEYQTALSIVAALLVCPIALASRQSLRVPDNRTWVLLAITIVLGGAGHFIMNWAHAYTPLMLASLLTLASPVVSVAAAAVILGEPVLLGHVVGIAIVVASLGIVVAHTTTSS
jgi:drug/metabolite transporter (DMT)-like permease